MIERNYQEQAESIEPATGAEIVGGQEWQPPQDFSMLIDTYLTDYFEIECKVESIKDLCALQWSGACMYVGSHLRPITPLPKQKAYFNMEWTTAQGIKTYFLFMLNTFFYYCAQGAKVPYTFDFWRFVGLSAIDSPWGVNVMNGITPEWLQSIINTIKQAEKQGLESILTDRKTNTQGAITLLQNRHGYTTTGQAETIQINVVGADSLPYFGNIAQCENGGEE